MSNILVFDPENGAFLRQETAIPDQKNPGQFLLPPHSVLESEAAGLEPGPNQTLKLDNGSVSVVADYREASYFAKATGEKIEFAIGQSPDSTMTEKAPGEYETGPWIEDPGQWSVNQAKVNEAKTKMIEQIEAIRAYKEFIYRSTVTVHGIQWDSGAKYLRNLERAISIYAIEPVPAWLDKDNNSHTVPDAAYLEQIRAAVDLDTFQAGQTLYAAKWAKRTEINALLPGDLATYNLESGWPW